ncbi:protein C10 isoform X3 [Bombus fervidus]|uniref:protein C10 isoform X3 n=1 Tax=Bombus fervidus TaxID=203811 RepID=UPI003AB1A272
MFSNRFDSVDNVSFLIKKGTEKLSWNFMALNTPENTQKLAEAKENSGNEMLKMMQFVFPIVVQIQMDVIKNYGFSEGREGTVQFVQLLRALEREDPEIAQLHSQVRSYFLPPVTISSSTEASL